MLNSFKLRESEYLFFDIFHKNNKLYLICPVYSGGVDIAQLNIYCNNRLLSLHEKHTKTEYEAVEVLIYNFYSEKSTNTIVVSYQNSVNEYNLTHIYSAKHNELSISTLFKDDYNLINIFYEYYRRQGVTNFYLYYNGKLTDDIITKYSLPGVTLVEWDFIYHTKRCIYSLHHAQPGQLHHAIYRYAKDVDEYIILCDLDEYLHIPNSTLLDYFKSDPCVDSFCFGNSWSETEDDIVPNEFPRKFKCANMITVLGTRSKCAYKVDCIDTVNIHKPRDASNGETITKDHVMYHFYKWSGADRSNDNIPKGRINNVVENIVK